MIRTAVCDDEEFFLREISEKITGYFHKKRIEISLRKYVDGNSLINEQTKPDIIFLDIQMNDPNGIETARRLRSQGYDGYLIFVTVLRDNVFDAFEFGAFDYLVKPLDEQRFQSTMDRLLRSLRSNEERLYVQTKSEQSVIPFSEILYCEVLNRKIDLHLTSGTVITYYDKIDALKGKLDERFFKPHRSFLVNLEHVRGCRSDMILLDNEEKVPLSKLRTEDFHSALIKFISGNEKC